MVLCFQVVFLGTKLVNCVYDVALEHGLTEVHYQACGRTTISCKESKQATNLSFLVSILVYLKFMF